MRKARMFAALLSAAALGVGLIGVGVHAAFTDSATAKASIATPASYGIVLTSTSPGVVGSGSHSLTLTGAPITSSGAGSLALAFQVENTGSIPATVTITPTDSLTSEFNDLLTGTPIVVTVPAGASSVTYNGGIGWGTLSDASLGKTESVTYTASASN